VFSDQHDRVEVGVQAVHDHQPIGAGVGIRTKCRRDVVDRAEQSLLARAGEPVVEGRVARPEIVDRACPVHCFVTGLPDDAVDGDGEAHRRRITADLGARLDHALADVRELIGTGVP
jgi:hypothetical protein